MWKIWAGETLNTCSVSHLRLRAAVRVVFGRQVGDDEAVVARAVNPSVTDAAQGQLVDLPAIRTLWDVGDDGVGEARHHNIVWKKTQDTHYCLYILTYCHPISLCWTWTFPESTDRTVARVLCHTKKLLIASMKWYVGDCRVTRHKRYSLHKSDVTCFLGRAGPCNRQEH